MGRTSTKENKNSYQLAREELGLTREKASELINVFEEKKALGELVQDSLSEENNTGKLPQFLHILPYSALPEFRFPVRPALLPLPFSLLPRLSPFLLLI